jgi:hypothetical protein
MNAIVRQSSNAVTIRARRAAVSHLKLLQASGLTTFAPKVRASMHVATVSGSRSNASVPAARPTSEGAAPTSRAYPHHYSSSRCCYAWPYPYEVK